MQVELYKDGEVFMFHVKRGGAPACGSSCGWPGVGCRADAGRVLGPDARSAGMCRAWRGRVRRRLGMAGTTPLEVGLAVL